MKHSGLIKKSNKSEDVRNYSTQGLAGPSEDVILHRHHQKSLLKNCTHRKWLLSKEKSGVVAKHVLKSTRKNSGLDFVKLHVRSPYSAVSFLFARDLSHSPTGREHPEHT